MNLALAGWTVRGFDGVSAKPEGVLRRLESGLKEGAGILIHEGRLAQDGSRLAPRVLAGLLQAMSRSELTTGFPD
jgi:hypothetical protein